MDIIGARNCRSCKFFEGGGDQGTGECHLSPPLTQLFLIGMSDKGVPTFHRAVVTQTTPGEYWCSHWVKKLAIATN
jgi:hypothetical protein